MDKTEEIILKAAKKVFTKKGLDGARMQEIADEAGINKALLHYYFRSKEKLFETIFKSVIDDFVPSIGSILDSDLSIEDTIKEFINTYFNLLSKNPDLPPFIISEVNRDPETLINLIRESWQIQHLVEKIKLRFSREKNIPNDPIQYFTSILSMIIFPFVARPIFKYGLFKNNDQLLEIYYKERKQYVYKFALTMLKS